MHLFLLPSCKSSSTYGYTNRNVLPSLADYWQALYLKVERACDPTVSNNYQVSRSVPPSIHSSHHSPTWPTSGPKPRWPGLCSASQRWAFRCTLGSRRPPHHRPCRMAARSPPVTTPASSKFFFSPGISNLSAPSRKSLDRPMRWM